MRGVLQVLNDINAVSCVHVLEFYLPKLTRCFARSLLRGMCCENYNVSLPADFSPRKGWCADIAWFSFYWRMSSLMLFSGVIDNFTETDHAEVSLQDKRNCGYTANWLHVERRYLMFLPMVKTIVVPARISAMIKGRTYWKCQGDLKQALIFFSHFLKISACQLRLSCMRKLLTAIQNMHICYSSDLLIQKVPW